MILKGLGNKNPSLQYQNKWVNYFRYKLCKKLKTLEIIRGFFVMRGRIDLGFIELDENDLAPTPEEIAQENEQKLREIKEEGKKIEEVEETNVGFDINIDKALEDEERKARGLGVTDKAMELVMLKMKEQEDKNKAKARKRFIVLSILIFVFAVMLIAYLAGYEIYVPEPVLLHMQGIWNTAKDAVMGFLQDNLKIFQAAK